MHAWSTDEVMRHGAFGPDAVIRGHTFGFEDAVPVFVDIYVPDPASSGRGRRPRSVRR
jgi:hypothetical protein